MSVYSRIIGQLETLKKEAADVQRKVDETDVVMGEVERVSQQYLPLSSACSSIYFTLESLHQVLLRVKSGVLGGLKNTAGCVYSTDLSLSRVSHPLSD